MKPKGSPEQISLFVFVGSFECFDVGDYVFLKSTGLSIYVSVVSSACSTSQKSVPEVSEATSNGGGAESGSNVIVPLACQSLPVRRVEFWVLA